MKNKKRWWCYYGTGIGNVGFTNSSFYFDPRKDLGLTKEELDDLEENREWEIALREVIKKKLIDNINLLVNAVKDDRKDD